MIFLSAKWMTILVIMSAANKSAADNFTSDSIDKTSSKAKTFLCQQFSFCLSQSPQTVIKPGLEHLAYFDKNTNQIWLSPHLDTIELQLSLVHELSHVYRNQFNKNDDLWLEEGMAKWIEYRYSQVWPVSYATRLMKNPNIILSNDPDFYSQNGNGYPSSFWLFLYLYNHFGESNFIKLVMESPLSGWDNVLTAIHKLKSEHVIQIPDALLTKESILRHFAVALWMNDAFLAQYALFAIDDQFEAVSENHSSFADSFASTQGTQIIYSNKIIEAKSSSCFAITSYTPFHSSSCSPEKSAKVFVYIRDDVSVDVKTP
jgi:hypothetical protein